MRCRGDYVFLFSVQWKVSERERHCFIFENDVNGYWASVCVCVSDKFFSSNHWPLVVQMNHCLFLSKMKYCFVIIASAVSSFFNRWRLIFTLNSWISKNKMLNWLLHRSTKSTWYLLLWKHYTAWLHYIRKNFRKSNKRSQAIGSLVITFQHRLPLIHITHVRYWIIMLAFSLISFDNSVRASSNPWSRWHFGNYRFSGLRPVYTVNRIFVHGYIVADSMFRMVHSVLSYWSHHFVVDRSLEKSTQHHRGFCKFGYLHYCYHHHCHCYHHQLANSHLELVQAEEQQIQFQLQQLEQKEICIQWIWFDWCNRNWSRKTKKTNAITHNALLMKQHTFRTNIWRLP